MKNEIIVITGGVKSGKSSYALRCGEEKGAERAFVATATALDDEMAARINAHRLERGSRWKTFEEPRHIADLIAKIAGAFDVILIDCLTLWVSNLLTVYSMTRDAMDEECKKLIDALQGSSAKIILVTNEVGLGIIPADHISRSYQNLLGQLNRDAAKAASSAYFMVAGLPLKMK